MASVYAAATTPGGVDIYGWDAEGPTVTSRLRDVLGLPITAARWWRRMTRAPSVELWVLIAGLPALLTLSWLSGLGGQLAFGLSAESLWASERTLRTALTANYAHFSGRHLLDNLLNFWVTLFAIYPLVDLAGWGRRFRLSVGVYLLVVPFVIGAVTLAVTEPSTSQFAVGFSGIVAALLGFLPVVLAAAASRATDGAVDPAWAGVPFCGSLAIAAAFSPALSASARPAITVGWLLAGGLLAGGCWVTGRPQGLARRADRLPPDHKLAFLIGATVFVFGVAGAFVFVGESTNVWGHLAGYVAGFLFPYLGFVVVPGVVGLFR